MGLLREVFGPSKNEIWAQLSQENRLQALFALFSLVLTELCRLEAAYAKAPGVNF